MRCPQRTCVSQDKTNVSPILVRHTLHLAL
uniref:Uncharacterized protein n=1 Tax=Anguilla anguilla TaxID=7936 RepID=A0A0E9TKU1_ANGAN